MSQGWRKHYQNSLSVYGKPSHQVVDLQMSSSLPNCLDPSEVYRMYPSQVGKAGNLDLGSLRVRLIGFIFVLCS